jgi:hypothetical protein
MRARLVQMLRDDRADGIMPDLIRPDVVGMLFPFVPVRSRPEYEVAEVQAAARWPRACRSFWGIRRLLRRATAMRQLVGNLLPEAWGQSSRLLPGEAYHSSAFPGTVTAT